jgi:hypothetical protein
MRLLGGHVEAHTPPIDAPWAAPLAEVAAKAVSPDPTARYANATEMLAAVRRVVVARLAPKLTVSALVEAVAGGRIRARNDALGVTRPDPSARSSQLPREPANETPLPALVAAPAPEPAPPPQAPQATPPKPPAEPEPPAEESFPSLTSDDRTPLRTVDPVTGEERPVFRSDPPASADLIEVVELDIPVDKPSRPANVRPPAPPLRKQVSPPRPPPPLPSVEPRMTQSATDMGSVARVSPPNLAGGSMARWTIVAACAVAMGFGLWILTRPRAEPSASASSAAVSAAPAAPMPAPSPLPSPAPTQTQPPQAAASAPANEPSPFDPSSSDDHHAPARASTRPAAPPPPTPAAGPAHPPPAAPASSTGGKKRVYDPQGI